MGTRPSGGSFARRNVRYLEGRTLSRGPPAGAQLALVQGGCDSPQCGALAAGRLFRENRYEEAPQIYQSIRAVRRAPRIRELAALYAEANRKDVPAKQAHEAAY